MSDITVISICSGLSLISLIAGCISAVFTRLLHYNVFVFVHNWIIPPNMKMKISSIISCIFQTVQLFVDIAFWILNIWYYEFYQHIWNLTIAIEIMSEIGRTCFYFYLIFNIENEMKYNEIIRSAVSKKWLFIIKTILIMDTLYFPIFLYLLSYFLNRSESEWQLFTLINTIESITVLIFYDISLLYIYVRAVIVYAKWWFSKETQESQQYGINQREHQILIKTTRFCNVFIIGVIIDILSVCLSVITIQISNWENVSIVILILQTMVEDIGIVIHIGAIFFSYEFGYGPYLKICGRLHNFVYSKIESIYQQKVHNNYIQLMVDK